MGRWTQEGTSGIHPGGGIVYHGLFCFVLSMRSNAGDDQAGNFELAVPGDNVYLYDHPGLFHGDGGLPDIQQNRFMMSIFWQQIIIYAVLCLAVSYLIFYFIRRRKLKKNCDNCPLNKNINLKSEKQINKPV